MAISRNRLRFCRQYPVIRPGAARFPRRFAPRNDKFGGIVRSAMSPYNLQACKALRERRSLSKKSLRAFFAKLLSELQNQILQHDFAILPLRRVIKRERTP